MKGMKAIVKKKRTMPAGASLIANELARVEATCNTKFVKITPLTATTALVVFLKQSPFPAPADTTSETPHVTLRLEVTFPAGYPQDRCQWRIMNPHPTDLCYHPQCLEGLEQDMMSIRASSEPTSPVESSEGAADRGGASTGPSPSTFESDLTFYLRWWHGLDMDRSCIIHGYALCSPETASPQTTSGQQVQLPGMPLFPAAPQPAESSRPSGSFSEAARFAGTVFFPDGRIATWGRGRVNYSDRSASAGNTNTNNTASSGVKKRLPSSSDISSNAVVSPGTPNVSGVAHSTASARNAQSERSTQTGFGFLVYGAASSSSELASVRLSAQSQLPSLLCWAVMPRSALSEIVLKLADIPCALLRNAALLDSVAKSLSATAPPSYAGGGTPSAVFRSIAALLNVSVGPATANDYVSGIVAPRLNQAAEYLCRNGHSFAAGVLLCCVALPSVLTCSVDRFVVPPVRVQQIHPALSQCLWYVAYVFSLVDESIKANEAEVLAVAMRRGYSKRTCGFASPVEDESSCCVCNQRLFGSMIIYCPLCQHGGHVAHMEAWRRCGEVECPTGCGCHCVY